MCAVLSCSLQFSQTPVPSNVGKFIPAFYIGLTDLVPWKPNLIFHLMDGMFWNSAAIEFLTDGLHVRIRVRVCVRARTHTYTHTHTQAKAWHFQYPERAMKVPHVMYSPSLLQTEILRSFVKGYTLNAIYGIKLSNSENQWHAFDCGADKMLSERCSDYGTKCHVHEAWTEKKWRTIKYNPGSAAQFRPIRKTAKSYC